MPQNKLPKFSRLKSNHLWCLCRSVIQTRDREIIWLFLRWPRTLTESQVYKQDIAAGSNLLHWDRLLSRAQLEWSNQNVSIGVLTRQWKDFKDKRCPEKQRKTGGNHTAFNALVLGNMTHPFDCLKKPIHFVLAYKIRFHQGISQIKFYCSVPVPPPPPCTLSAFLYKCPLALPPSPFSPPLVSYLLSSPMHPHTPLFACVHVLTVRICIRDICLLEPGLPRLLFFANSFLFLKFS